MLYFYTFEINALKGNQIHVMMKVSSAIVHCSGCVDRLTLLNFVIVHPLF